MKLDRIDALVAVFTVATFVAAVGMIFDVWQGVYYSIPVFSFLFMLIGSLNARDEWSPQALVPVVAFGVVLAGLFVVAGVLIESDTTWGGLPAATAVFTYLVWPVSVVGAPLAYAAVYQGWLSRDAGMEKAAPRGRD